MLQQHPDEPFIHLGDVLDLSCRTEARRVREIFAATDNAGAILPGNHDGLMFGIYGYNVLEASLDPEARKWNEGCRRGAGDDPAAIREMERYVADQDLARASPPAMSASLACTSKYAIWIAGPASFTFCRVISGVSMPIENVVIGAWAGSSESMSIEM